MMLSNIFRYSKRCQNQLVPQLSFLISTSQRNNLIELKRFSNSNSAGSDDKRFNWKAVTVSTLGIGGILFGYSFFNYLDNRNAIEATNSIENVKVQEIRNNSKGNVGKSHLIKRNDLPTFKMDDVQNHSTLATGIWITYGIGVYDITKFIPEHPGGDNILLAVGSAIDPFWHIYQQHNTKEILTLLETFRIGNLNPEDDIGTKDLASPWANEPKRHPVLKPTSERPFNAETPLKLLIDSFYTPKEFFYVRNHLPVPDIDGELYELEVEVEGIDKHLTLKLEDIKKLPKYTVTAAIMCSGNRRSEMIDIKPVRGLSWDAGAVGNAKWSGARLRDVLEMLNVKSDEKRHVIFEGCDLDPTSKPYGASIPLSKAMDERGDVLLVYEMNDEPLARDHGYPIRVLVPGVTGARNVKWLGRIIVSENESDSHWQQNDYKGFCPSVDWDTVDFTKSPAIQNMPVTSAICSPAPGEKVKIDDNGHIEVKGYAWSGGGNRIVRVDLTTDGGDTWYVAELDQGNEPAGRHWGWTIWTARIPIQKDMKECEIWSKAVDSNYNCQPESPKNIWNLRGVLSNAYHKVKINLA